jgi:hypothetical protein
MPIFVGMNSTGHLMLDCELARFQYRWNFKYWRQSIGRSGNRRLRVLAEFRRLSMLELS